MTSSISMHEAGQSKPVLWDNPEGWGGEGAGRGVQDEGTHEHPWVIHIEEWQKPLQYCKEKKHFPIKINKLNFKSSIWNTAHPQREWSNAARAARMDLKVVVDHSLTERSESETDIIQYHLHMESKTRHKGTYLWNREARRQNRLCGFQQGGGLGEEWTGNLGLADATY